MAQTPLISICIVSGGRQQLLDRCLASLQQQKDAPAFELLVCANGDASVHATVPAMVHRRFPEASVCLIPRTRPGAGRNVLIKRARGELLLFLDDDVIVQPHMLARTARLADRLTAVAVFGGPNVTPPDSSPFQQTQGAVLASVAACGPVRRRYGAYPAGPADERYFTLCNLVIRRSAMIPFCDELDCAEENAVLAEMQRIGLVMHYDPSLGVYHERRPTIAAFSSQMLKYGYGRGQLLARDASTFRPAYLVPVALLAYLPASSLLFAGIGWPSLLPLGAYLALAGATGTSVGRRLRRQRSVPLASLLVVLVHLCYGLGVVGGLTGSWKGSWRRQDPTSRPKATAGPQSMSVPLRPRGASDPSCDPASYGAGVSRLR